MEGLLPIATFALGVIFAVGGGIAIEAYRNRLSRHISHFAAQQQLEDQLRSQQRDLLLRLQEAGATLLVTTDRAIDEKSAAYARDGLWSEEQYDQTTRQAKRTSRVLAEQLAVLVYDNALRASALHAIRLETEVTSAQSQEEALRALEQMRTGLMEANDLLGEVLRSFL